MFSLPSFPPLPLPQSFLPSLPLSPLPGQGGTVKKFKNAPPAFLPFPFSSGDLFFPFPFSPPAACLAGKKGEEVERAISTSPLPFPPSSSPFSSPSFFRHRGIMKWGGIASRPYSSSPSSPSPPSSVVFFFLSSFFFSLPRCRERSRVGEESLFPPPFLRSPFFFSPFESAPCWRRGKREERDPFSSPLPLFSRSPFPFPPLPLFPPLPGIGGFQICLDKGERF